MYYNRALLNVNVYYIPHVLRYLPELQCSNGPYHVGRESMIKLAMIAP